MADTLDITDTRVRSETVRNVNKLGKHLVSDLKIPRWTENDNHVLKYIQALVAVSKPSISSKKGMDHEFEENLTSI